MSSELMAAIIRLRDGHIPRASLSERQTRALDIEGAVTAIESHVTPSAPAAGQVRPPDLLELERVVADVLKLG